MLSGNVKKSVQSDLQNFMQKNNRKDFRLGSLCTMLSAAQCYRTACINDHLPVKEMFIIRVVTTSYLSAVGVMDGI